VIETFKKSYELSKMSIIQLLELWDKGIEKTVYSCVDFACATFGPLHHAFTLKAYEVSTSFSPT